MTRAESRKVLNQRGASQLDSQSLAILHQLINSTFVPKDAPNLPLHKCKASISDIKVAEKTGVRVHTVRRRLEMLQTMLLVKENTDKNTGRKSWSVDLTSMCTWKTAKQANIARLEKHRAKERIRMQNYRKNKAVEDVTNEMAALELRRIREEGAQ